MKCPKCNTENPSDSKYYKECATLLPSPEDISVSHTENLEAPKEELSTGVPFAKEKMGTVPISISIAEPC